MNCVLQKMLKSWPPKSVNLSWYGNRAFADDPVKMRSLGWALIQYDRVFIKRGNLDTERHIQWEDTVKTQGEQHPQAKEHLKLPKARREAWKRFSPPALRTNPVKAWFQTSSLQNWYSKHLLFKPSVYGNLLQQPQ